MACLQAKPDNSQNAAQKACCGFPCAFFSWKNLSSKWLSLTIGVVSTSLALVLIPVCKSNSVFAIVNKFVNGLGSPLLCLMLLGMFSKKTNSVGVFVGGIIGLFASLAISFWLRPLALHYYAVANLLVCLASCYICSLRRFVWKVLRAA